MSFKFVGLVPAIPMKRGLGDKQNSLTMQDADKPRRISVMWTKQVSDYIWF